MVLEPEMRHLVAECIEKIVVAVVMRTEEGLRFKDEVFVLRDLVPAHLEGGLVVAGDVEEVGGTSPGADVDFPEMPSRKHRRIDERGKGDRIKIYHPCNHAG